MAEQRNNRGGFHVQAKQCATCIYRPDCPLDLAKLERAIADPYGGFTGHRACHHDSSGGTCCRVFWDRHKDAFQLGQVAQRLGMVVFVHVDDLGKKAVTDGKADE